MDTSSRHLCGPADPVRCAFVCALGVLLLACEPSNSPEPDDGPAPGDESVPACEAAGSCEPDPADPAEGSASGPADEPVDATDGPGCQRRCDGSSCSDGCGGRCACPDSALCDAEERCVSPDRCADTCASVGAACGVVCGEPCGECGLRQACVAGACVEAVSCSQCALSLGLADLSAAERARGHIALAIDHWPVPDDPAARAMDLRVVADADVELIGAVGGDALRLSNKDLYVDPETGSPFRRREDGSWQVFVYRRDSAEPIAAGRIATLTFAVEQGGPLTFKLQRRQQTFAPLLADAVLQATPYDQTLTVTR
jgi:hypothetical protein